MTKSNANALSLVELLRTFRSLEEDSDAIVVLGDDDAMRVLSAWRKTDQAWKPPKAKMPIVAAGNHAAVWGWVCAGWHIDYAAIARGAGLSERIVYEKMMMLLGARLIYPDGGVSKAASTALQLHVAQKLGIKPKRKKEPPKGESDNSN